MVYFCGNKKQLAEFLRYMVERYGRDTRVADLPTIMCN